MWTTDIMTQPPTEIIDENGNKQHVISLLPVEIRYAKSPAKSLPLAGHFLEPVGRLILQWGMIEREVDRLIIRLHTSTNSELEERWHTENFAKRVKRLRRAARRGMGLYPKGHAYLTGMLDSAADINWKRNLLVHGDVGLKVVFRGEEAEQLCRTTGRHNGRVVSLDLSIHQLKTMYSELEHIAAKLTDLTEGCDYAAEQLPLRDTRKLRELFGPAHQSPTNPTTP